MFGFTTGTNVTVCIPTYYREDILINTIGYLLDQKSPDIELLVIDQTPCHKSIIEKRLKEFDREGDIRWFRRGNPSITESMNFALCRASSPIVLFVDDDIIPSADLVKVHASAYQESEDIWAVVGQVLQPKEESVSDSTSYKINGLRAFLDFKFYSTSRRCVKNVIACNLSVRRERALEIGGFDMNFIGAAYRFETEFCRRVWQHGGKVLFEPKASIRHLKVERGGIRKYGSHLSSSSPMHSVGDYYFALRQGVNSETLRYIFRRPFREISTKFHLKHPWWIPVKLLGEIRALLLAMKLYQQGPRLIQWPPEG